MTHSHTGTAMSGTRPRGVTEGFPAPPSEPASDAPRRREAYGTLSSAGTKALIAVCDQAAFPGPKQPPSRNSRNWLLASLCLLVLFAIAVACWCVVAGPVGYKDDPYVDVGQAGQSSDVSGIDGGRRRMIGQIPDRPNARQFPIKYRAREDLPPADEADLETAERDCRRTLSNIEPQSKQIVSR